MASLRVRLRKDGTQYYAVLYRHSGKQTSHSFEDFLSATRFCEVINKFGVQNALATLNASSFTSETVTQWVEHYIDHLTGVEPETVVKYRAYLRNDIGPGLGDIPLTGLTPICTSATRMSSRIRSTCSSAPVLPRRTARPGGWTR